MPSPTELSFTGVLQPPSSEGLAGVTAGAEGLEVQPDVAVGGAPQAPLAHLLAQSPAGVSAGIHRFLKYRFGDDLTPEEQLQVVSALLESGARTFTSSGVRDVVARFGRTFAETLRTFGLGGNTMRPPSYGERVRNQGGNGLFVLERDLRAANYYSMHFSPFGTVQHWVESAMQGGEKVRYLGIGVGRGYVERDLRGAFGDKIEIDALGYFPPEAELGSEVLARRRAIFNTELPPGDINNVELLGGDYDRILALFSTYYAADQTDVIQKLHDGLRVGGEAFFVMNGKNAEARALARLMMKYPLWFWTHGFDFVVHGDTHTSDIFVTLRKLGEASRFRTVVAEIERVDKIVAKLPEVAAQKFLESYRSSDGRLINPLAHGFRLRFADQPANRLPEPVGLENFIRQRLAEYQDRYDFQFVLDRWTALLMREESLRKLKNGEPVEGFILRLLVRALQRKQNPWFSLPAELVMAHPPPPTIRM